MTDLSPVFVLIAVLIVAAVAVSLIAQRRRPIRVNDWERVAVYVDGGFDRLLEPGRHLLWGDRRRVMITHVHLTPQYAAVGPIDVVSKDRAPLRLSATLVHRLDDVVRSLSEPVWPEINLVASNALRRLAAGLTLDELLTHGENADAALASLIGPRVGAAESPSRWPA